LNEIKQKIKKKKVKKVLRLNKKSTKQKKIKKLLPLNKKYTAQNPLLNEIKQKKVKNHF
jgi:hypothetical protein